MPAFQLKQFQQQITQLLLVFALPTEFHQQLTRLLERYEQPSYRYGDGVKAPPEPAYHLQAAILDRITHELVKMAVERPRSALLLAQECWQDPYYETRYVAAVVMGATPLFDVALFEEIFQNMLGISEVEFLHLLFGPAIQQFRQAHFSTLIEWITGWLESADTRSNGYAAILGLVKNGNLDHLPTVFRLMEPLIITGTASEQAQILTIMDALARLSPMESAHFLSELTRHFYGEARMHYFRALCRSLAKPERDFVNRAFMDPSAYYHEEDIIDD